MFSLVAYFFTFFLINVLRKKHNNKFKSFPYMKMQKNGIVFTSFLQHRIRIYNIKYLQMGTNIYLKTSTGIVIISNVKILKHEKDFLYFKCFGEIKILFDCKKIFRYFNIRIESEKFKINHLKHMALMDLINSGFDENKSKMLQKYIKILKNILNIYIFDEKIIVKQNKFLFPFTIKYKLNNRVKIVYINQILEEI